MGGRVCLGFESARDVWRAVGARVADDNPASEDAPPLLVRLLFDEGRGVDLRSVPACTRATKVPDRIDLVPLAAVRAEWGELEGNAQICVARREARHFVAGARCHLMTGGYPAGSFRRIAPGSLVAVPELTFLQMARSLDFELLVAYGYELCGYFAKSHEEPGFRNCPQLTSVARIADYLDRLERLRASRGEGMPWGLCRARRALAFVRDGAASPEEAVVSIVLSLPRRLGGYGVRPALLNERVTLGRETTELFGIDSFVCDLSWNGGAQVLEYHGEQHKQRSRWTYDLRKGNVLAADGRTVLEMGRSMLARRDLMDEVAKSVMAAIGDRWRSPGADVATRQIRLRNRLIAYIDAR